jgi:hypothetical protein
MEATAAGCQLDAQHFVRHGGVFQLPHRESAWQPNNDRQ